MAASIRLKQICDNYGVSPVGIQYALEQYQKVIWELTNGRLSKVTYPAEVVIAEIQNCFEEAYAEWHEEGEE